MKKGSKQARLRAGGMLLARAHIKAPWMMRVLQDIVRERNMGQLCERFAVMLV